MSKRLVLLVVALVAIVAAWEVASPWWTLRNMRDAARARDGERLSSYIDYPRVRSNVRQQLMGLADARGASPLESFVRRVGASLVVDPAVDAIVSPKALRLAFIVGPENKRNVDAADGKCGMTRESLDRFRVRCARLAKGRADLIFEREGLGWRLVAIDLRDKYGATVS
jgi:hypothetical protein